MPLDPGSRLGAYEIREAIGAGGMGEVYRARDTRLQRDVALKILPEAFASDPDRLARFDREAQMLAALNHPHIAQIYGLESDVGPNQHTRQVRALVLELVDGETLAERISTGPLPVGDVLSIARQIADALEAAHEQGIVHRDLKPSNIKVRPDGTVKVLDFGLAKLAQGPGPGPDAAVSAFTMSPTITTPAMTQVGVIMGTAAYLSPEQAKGREADKRSDVWAFGAVLYEMLTGHRAFEGDDISDTFASVLKIDPDWARFDTDVPVVLRTLIQRCLTKDRRQRVSDIGAAKFVLNELQSIDPARGPVPVAESSRPHPAARWRWLIPATAGALIGAIVVAGVTWALRPTAAQPVVAQFTFSLPDDQNFSGTGRQIFAISPDGTQIVYVANQRLYVRSIHDLEPRALAGTETELGATNPVFSPDGLSVAYFAAGGSSDSILKRIPVSGGAPSILSNTGVPSGVSWGPSGILFGQGGQREAAIMRVGPNGGKPERLITLGDGERAHGPQLLPDGKHVLFTLAKGTSLDRWDHAQIVVHSLVDGSRHVVVDGGTDARYLPTGHVIYAVSGTVFAVPFDAARVAVTGSAVPVIVGVRRASATQTGSAHLAVSDTGTLVYRPGPATDSPTERGLIVGDGRSDPVSLKVPRAAYSHPRAAPDGSAIVVARADGTASDIWAYDLSAKSEIKRLTFDGSSRFPIWSADSRHVTFQSAREGDRGIWWQSADSSVTERLTRAAQDEEHVPESWSHSGTKLLFAIVKGSTRSLWILTLDGKKIEPFGKLDSAEPFSVTFSPDDRWVAYARSMRAGGLSSPDRGVYVEPFPPTGEKHQAPKAFIDYHPAWSPDGTRLLFVPASTRPTMSVAITTRPTVAFGPPVESPRLPRPALLSTDARGYDVIRDGRVVSVSPGPDESAQTPGAQVRVILNWFEELRRLAPVK